MDKEKLINDLRDILGEYGVITDEKIIQES